MASVSAWGLECDQVKGRRVEWRVGRAGGECTETDDELLVVDALLKIGHVFKGDVRAAARVSTEKTGEHGTKGQL